MVEDSGVMLPIHVQLQNSTLRGVIKRLRFPLEIMLWAVAADPKMSRRAEGPLSQPRTTRARMDARSCGHWVAQRSIGIARKGGSIWHRVRRETGKE